MLTQQQLETHLWDCALKLRGSLDTAGVRGHLLTLMCYKRLVDQAEFEARTGRPTRIDIPVGCSWAAMVADSAKGIGKRLEQAMAKLEAANPELRDVFRAAEWAATVSVGGQRRRRIDDRVLHELVQAFAQHDLSNANVDPDVLGQAYAYLLDRFAAEARARGGEYYTPREVAEVLVRLLDPAPGASIHDPTCGSGGMLVYAAEQVRRDRGDDAARSIRLSGQERNPDTWAIARMNVLLHDLQADIRGGTSTLTDPLFTHGEGGLDTFDVVLANFPFGDTDWGHERLQADPFRRFERGLPPRRCGDFAYLQHIVACVNETGRAGVVCSQGVLFHVGVEASIRAEMLRDGLIEAVVALPGKLFHGIDAPACLLLLNHRENDEQQRDVFFVQASRDGDYEAGPHQNRLRPQDVDRIVAAFRSREDVEGYCRTVSLEEMATNHFNLSISLYVRPTESEDGGDLRAAVADLRQAMVSRDEAMRMLWGHLEELGLDG